MNLYQKINLLNYMYKCGVCWVHTPPLRVTSSALGQVAGCSERVTSEAGGSSDLAALSAARLVSGGWRGCSSA